MLIPMAYDEDLLKIGDNSLVGWNPEVAPHMAVCGSTGSGKTYFTKLLLGRIAIYAPDSQIYLMDFKGDADFAFLAGTERFSRYNECADGLDTFYERFLARQRGDDASRNIMVMMFDEWASFLNGISEDKKQMENRKRMLASLLMLGRSFKCHVILSQQRLDAAYFATARDNINCVVALGNLSPESIEMVFSAYKKQIYSNRKRGTGYMLTNGSNLTRIVVPTVNNMDKLHAAIRDGVIR
jgi:DNA segregation ATPase FtsK/SpoIIIE-like protein